MPKPLLALAALVLAVGCGRSPATGPAPDPGDRSESRAEDPRPEPVPVQDGASDFDAEAWAERARTAEDDATLVRLSEQLLGAVDWRVACGEDDPTAPRRGIVQVHAVGDVPVAEVTCQVFAGQPAFALVDLRGPSLVRGFEAAEDGSLSGEPSASFYGTLTADPAGPGTFDVLTTSAGHGGCGTDVRHRLLPAGETEVVSVRANADCSSPTPPESWPQTYPRP